MTEPLNELVGVDKEVLDTLREEYTTTDMDESEYEERLDFICEHGIDPEHSERGEVLLCKIRAMIEDCDLLVGQDASVQVSESDYSELADQIRPGHYRGEYQPELTVYDVPVYPYSGDIDGPEIFVIEPKQ